MIFISHSSRDRRVAETLCAAIEARGHSCWIASRDVGGGRNFQDAIVEAIQSAAAMVLVFSQNANNSAEIKKEIALAGQQKLSVIPVRVEDVLPTGGFLYELATRQWIDLFENWEAAVDLIVTRIDAVVGTVPLRPPRPPERPRRPRKLARLALAGGGVSLAAVLAIGAYWMTSPVSPLQAYPAAPPETPQARVNSFSVVVRIGVDPFKRLWTRVKPNDWVERSDEGAKTYYTAVRRIVLGDCPGTVLNGDEEKTKHVFVPDKGCSGMPLKVSYERGATWGTAGTMTEVE